MNDSGPPFGADLTAVSSRSGEGAPIGPLAAQEIFGRFVLLEQLDAHGAETCRAVDLERELQPIVTVRRLPRWGTFPKREKDAFEAASQLRSRAHGELLAQHVDAGNVEGVAYWATQYVPGISIDRLIERAVDRGELSKGMALTTAYCAIACVLDLVADHFDRCPNILVAPLIHPRRFVLSWTGRPFFLGTSYEQSQPDDEEKRFTPPHESRRSHGAADAFGLAGLIFELCTGTPFTIDVNLETKGPLGSVPAELRRALAKALSLQHGTVRELMHVVEPLMKAAGGGHFSEVARELDDLCGDVKQAETALLEKEAALAKKLRKRMRSKSSEAATLKLRLRPASQEGEALLENSPDTSSFPDEMVFVAGGRFLFGQQGSGPTEDSVKATYIDVAPFVIDKFPVTTQEYWRYVQATGAEMPASWTGRYPEEQAGCPVVGVTPDEAEAYAKWANKRLLSEVEWELAARGFDGRMWPWGHEFSRDLMPSTWMTPWRTRRLAPVGQHSPHGDSPFGVADLGQAWEWTSTPHAEGGRVVRGGPWRNRLEPPSISNRAREEFASPDVTFRCARSVNIPRIGLAKPPPAQQTQKVPMNLALDDDTKDDIE